MSKVLVGSLVMTLVLLAGSTATAQVRSWDNLDWWAQSGASPDPVKASGGPGYWWWPMAPTSNADDGNLWGNRGVVYGMFTPAPPPPPPPPPEPPPLPPPPETPAAASAPTPQRSVPVLNNVLFDFDKSKVKDSGRVEIAKVAGILKDNPGDIVTIEGHTCDINRSGDPDYNVKLGQRRAETVMAVLLENGISEGRVSTASFGESRPAVPNTSDENRQLNRRVVFVYSISD